MSRHHKSLTLNALNDTWDEIGRQSRLQELRINQMRADAMNAATRAAKVEIDKARAETNERLKKEVKDLEQRTNSHIADLDRRHNENLLRATNQIYDEMKQGFEDMAKAIVSETEALNGRIDSVEQWTQQNLDIIDRNIHRMQQDTNKRFEQQQHQIDSLHSNIQSIQERFRNEDSMARDAANEMTQLLEVVCENHPVQIYAPDKLREIRAHINDLISHSDWPSASIIAVSDGIIQDIMKMKEITILEKAKHDQMLRQTKKRLTAILEVIGKNINLPIEHEGKVATIATDHWTNNEFTKVQNQLEAIEKQLENEENKNQLSVDKIADLLKEIERLNLESVALMDKALNRAVQSYDRAAVSGLDIVNGYLQQGYELKVENGEDDYGYIEEDQRKGVFIILRHPITKNEISILLQPNPDDKTNRIDFHIDNPNQPITAQQLHILLEDFRQRMDKMGYDIGPIEIPSDGGDEIVPQMQSGQQLRQAGAEEKLREILR